MPISERDQKLIDQMEADFRAQGLKPTRILVSVANRLNRRRSVTLSLAGAIVGITMVLSGLISQVIVVSVFGFLVLSAAVVFASTVSGRERRIRDSSEAGSLAEPTE